MDSYSVCYHMVVFGVKCRLGLIQPQWAPQLYATIGQLLKECGHQPVKIGGISDHVHILYRVGRSGKSMADTWEYVKAESSHWINKNRLSVGRFGWQNGYAEFSYSARVVGRVANYIEHQAEHHKMRSFRQEMEFFYEETGLEFRSENLPTDLV